MSDRASDYDDWTVAHSMSLSFDRFGRLLYAMCNLASAAGGGGAAGVLPESSPSDRPAALRILKAGFRLGMGHHSSQAA